MIPEAEEVIRLLQLEPHPEGGYYRETYRSDVFLTRGLPQHYQGGRNASTAIYFLLDALSFSAFHRLKSDEIWHFYLGDALDLKWINPDGSLTEIRMGHQIDRGEQLQVVIPAGCWFTAVVVSAGKWALTGCTVAPGFDFQDFEMADRESLLAAFPQHASLIRKFAIRGV